MKKVLKEQSETVGKNRQTSRLLALLNRFGVDRGGALFIVFALVLPVLIGATGLGIESGMWYLEKRRMQEAVDSGALAGAFEYRSNSSITDASLGTVVSSALTKSGYGSLTVTVNRPPTSGPFAVGGAQESQTAVEVIGTYTYPTYFIAAIGMDTITMNARAVAAQSGLANSACVLALGSTSYGGKAAIEVSGGGSAYLDGCSLHANGITDPAIDIGLNSSVYAECITGSNTMSATTLTAYNSVTPDPFTPGVDMGVYTSEECGEPSGTAGTVDDPFADLIAPDKTAEACSNSFPVAALDLPGSFFSMLAELIGVGTAHAGAGTDYAATPGNYCGFPPFNPNDTVAFAPGVYYIQGGMQIQGGISGDNVIFIMQGADADLNITAAAGLSLTAPTSAYIAANPALYAGLTDTDGTGESAWAGMLIYNETNGTSSCSTLSGDSTSSFSGAIYMPNSCMTFTGSSTATSANDCLQIVANQVTINGDAGLTTSGCGVYGSEFFSASAVGLVE